MAFLSNIQHLLNGVDIDNLLREINSLKKDISSAKKEVSRYSTSLTEKYNEIASLKQQNVSLSKDVNMERNKYSILEGKVDDLSKIIAELKNENEILGTSEQKFKDKYEKTIKSNTSLNGKNLALTNKVKALEEKTTLLETNQLRQQSELSEKDAIISMMEANYNKLQSDYNKNKEQLEDTNRTIESEKTAKKFLEDKLAQLQERNRILSERSDSLQVAVDELTSENSRLKENSAEAKEKINLLTEESSSKESEKSALHEELDKQKTENDSLQQQIQELIAEKEELSPYMYLVEAKKEQEAIESAIKEARENLQNSLDSAMSISSTIKHEEVKNSLEDVIKSSRELVDSIDCTLEELNDSKISLDSASNVAEEQEKKLIEQEESERKRSEEEEAERKRKEQGEAEHLLKEEEIAEQKHNEEEECFKAASVNTDEAVDEAFEDDTLPNIYDIGLIPAEKLSIPEVYDVKEDRIINARDFFSQHESELILWRRNLQEEYLMGNARFICPECKQPVKINGHKLQRGRVCYFAHFKDSDDCPYKTGTNRTKEEIERLKYSLVQESERHKRLKAAIASVLEGEKSKSMGVGKVECEKRINSEIPYLKWRRPDIYAEYNGRKYVFELQLSTTFVSVIVDRDIFYRLNNYHIIWVFNFEDNKEYVNLHNLMCKDIYYANKRNVFIFDADAEELSKERGELVLKCRWLDENGVWSSDEFVTLDMFQYDEESHKPFIIDADKAYLEKHPEYVERRKQLENSREDILKALMERQKHEEELERMRDAERSNLQSQLLNTDKCVERFRSGTKYGYHFEGTTIIPAKYTSAEIIGENGYAKVGFNRKIGLVRKDGKEIVPVEYKNIDIINSQHGIVMASYKRIDLWLGDEYFSLRSDYDDKKQSIIKEEENGKTNYILQTNTYSYSYSQSHYGGHPICHKNWSDHSKSTLFTVVENKEFCTIWINRKTYLLSKNRLSIVYTEKTIGQYHIRHSGELYSILSSNSEELVSYSLSEVLFISETTAIIKNTDGKSGLFVNGECEYFDGCKEIEHLYDGIFMLTFYYGKVKLYSSEVKKTSENSFIDITHLVGEILVVKTQGASYDYSNSYKNVYQLYRGINQLSSECFSSVVLLDNGYIALQKYGIGYNVKPTWKLANKNCTYLSDREYDSIIEANEELFKVSINGYEGFVDLNGNAIVEKNYCDNGLILTRCFADRGLEDADGTVILSLGEHFSNIEFLADTLLKVCKQNKYALFSIKGETLTDFKYTDILCKEDGSIQATRNSSVGGLDINGNEIADVETFAGGYLRSSYGDYSVFNDADEILIPTGYSKIEILDNDGILALWKGSKVAIGNIANEKTELVYESVRSIGNGFYAVSRTISKKIRVRHIGYGYRRNPYTYYTSDNKKEKKYGIIDRTLRIVITCKYSSISDFDDEQNLTTTNANGKKKTISLQNLKKKASHVLELSVGTEYDAKVQSFMPIGLIIKIQGNSFIVHKKYLFKEKKDFKKGESFIAKYLGKDNNGHPIWETKLNRSMDTE
ncbi:MAG: WG repeat-containing protein [Prevotella sp.]|nr:WG repeat-containing protein [Prevotella sp.]